MLFLRTRTLHEPTDWMLTYCIPHLYMKDPLIVCSFILFSKNTWSCVYSSEFSFSSTETISSSLP